MLIRAEAPSDIAGIHGVVASAFPTSAEARLVDELRRAGDLRVSLVALDDRQSIIGHAAFSPVTTARGDQGIGLAPVAVDGGHRCRGIAAQLIETGLAQCRTAGFAFAVVLGSPGYYGRFGFGPASRHGLADEYEGGEAFQVMPLQGPGSIPGGAGLVRYAAAFSAFA